MKKFFALAAALAFVGGLSVAQAADDGAAPADDEAAPVACEEGAEACDAAVVADDADDAVADEPVAE